MQKLVRKLGEGGHVSRERKVTGEKKDEGGGSLTYPEQVKPRCVHIVHDYFTFDNTDEPDPNDEPPQI